MRTVTAQEFARSLEDVEIIARREPVVIARQGGERLVLMSMEEYERLLLRSRRAFAVEDLPEWIVEAVGRADMDESFRDLDRLMD